MNDDFVAHGKDCVKALRAKLTAPTKGRAVMDADATLKALFALEMCMKNCGGRFHAMAVAKEVPETMVRLCERAPNLEVRDKTLALVHEWAVNLRREPAFAGAFHQLRARGFQFPEVERRSVARGATSSAAREDWNGGGDWSKREDISEEDRAAIARALEEDEEEAMPPVQRQRHGIYPGNIAMGTPVRAPHLSSPPASGRLADRAESELQRALRESERTAAAEASRATTSVSKTYNSQDVEKLKGDIAVATNSLKVFTQVLDGCVALRPPSPSSLANELSEQCRAMQPRLIELISNAEDEGLLASAIHLNDELTKEMERYDLLVKAAAGDVASRARLAAPVAATRTHGKFTERTRRRHASVHRRHDDEPKLREPFRRRLADGFHRRTVVVVVQSICRRSHPAASDRSLPVDDVTVAASDADQPDVRRRAVSTGQTAPGGHATDESRRVRALRLAADALSRRALAIARERSFRRFEPSRRLARALAVAQPSAHLARSPPTPRRV